MNGTQALNQLHSSLINRTNTNSFEKSTEAVSGEGAGSFASSLNQALSSLETKQFESTEAMQALIEGKADDMHTVMIKTTEAQLSLELAVQMRNKVLEAYNEVKNMQF